MYVWQNCSILPYEDYATKKEIWKPIEKLQFEDRYFEVSDQGRVRVYLHNPAQALDGRMSKKKKLIHLWEVNQVYCGGFYRIVVSYGKTYSVHHLVAEAFLENPNDCKQLKHIDGDKSNNAVSNLQWKRVGAKKTILRIEIPENSSHFRERANKLSQQETSIPDKMLEGF